MRTLGRGAARPQACQQWRTLRACPRVPVTVRRTLAPQRRGLAVFAVAAPEKAPKQGPGRPSKQPYKKTDDEDIMEKGMRELPRPADVQQTLVKSFTLGGIGLHTAEYAFIRVRPAAAGEGRYFVRVPKGTNASEFVVKDDTVVVDEEDMTDSEPVEDEEVERARVQLFTEYLAAQEDEGYKGTFVDFMEDLDSQPLSATCCSWWARSRCSGSVATRACRAATSSPSTPTRR